MPSKSIRFPERHPGHPALPITLRMMLSHRSGMGVLPHQGEWDTRCAFSPEFFPDCHFDVADLSMEEFYRKRLIPGGSDFDEGSWIVEPGQRYRYSLSAFGLMRYLVGRVSRQSFPRFMEENVFGPLGMEDSAVGGPKEPNRRAQPHARIHGENVELPLWDGNGYLMHKRATSFPRNGRESRDLSELGYGLGPFEFRYGWFGHRGSVPGFLALLRFNPAREVGHVIMANVNALHGGGPADRRSVLEEVFRVQDEILAILDSGEART